jgi:hypothetical protein
LDGLRQRGGVTLIQVLVGNVGNCALMIREKLKQSNCESESTEAKHSDGLTCSSEEVSVMEMERRSQIVRRDKLVNQQWEESVGQAKPFNGWTIRAV